MKEAKTAYHSPVTLGTTAHDGDDFEVVTVLNVLGFPAFWRENQAVVFHNDEAWVMAKLLNDLIQPCGRWIKVAPFAVHRELHGTETRGFKRGLGAGSGWLLPDHENP